MDFEDSFGGHSEDFLKEVIKGYKEVNISTKQIMSEMKVQYKSSADETGKLFLENEKALEKYINSLNGSNEKVVDAIDKNTDSTKNVKEVVNKNTEETKEVKKTVKKASEEEKKERTEEIKKREREKKSDNGLFKKVSNSFQSLGEKYYDKWFAQDTDALVDPLKDVIIASKGTASTLKNVLSTTTNVGKKSTGFLAGILSTNKESGKTTADALSGLADIDEERLKIEKNKDLREQRESKKDDKGGILGKIFGMLALRFAPMLVKIVGVLGSISAFLLGGKIASKVGSAASKVLGTMGATKILDAIFKKTPPITTRSPKTPKKTDNIFTQKKGSTEKPKESTSQRKTSGAYLPLPDKSTPTRGRGSRLIRGVARYGGPIIALNAVFDGVTGYINSEKDTVHEKIQDGMSSTIKGFMALPSAAVAWMGDRGAKLIGLEVEGLYDKINEGILSIADYATGATNAAVERVKKSEREIERLNDQIINAREEEREELEKRRDEIVEGTKIVKNMTADVLGYNFFGVEGIDKEEKKDKEEKPPMDHGYNFFTPAKIEKKDEDDEEIKEDIHTQTTLLEDLPKEMAKEIVKEEEKKLKFWEKTMLTMAGLPIDPVPSKSTKQIHIEPSGRKTRVSKPAESEKILSAEEVADRTMNAAYNEYKKDKEKEKNRTVKRVPFEDMFERYAEKYNVDPQLVKAVAKTESNFDILAKSGAGAIGLMQLMPETAKDLEVDPYDPEQNVEGGVKYLRQLLDRYDGNEEKALAAYNWGMGNVDRLGLDHKNRPKESREYPGKVFENRKSFELPRSDKVSSIQPVKSPNQVGKMSEELEDARVASEKRRLNKEDEQNKELRKSLASNKGGGNVIISGGGGNVDKSNMEPPEYNEAMSLTFLNTTWGLG